jgi:S1-C subfamily serine protease
MLEDLLGQVRPPKNDGGKTDVKPADPGVNDLIEDMLGDGAKPREKGFLGVRPSAAANAAGVAVDIVFPDTPAEKAGVKTGDVITSVGGTPVKDLDSLGGALGKYFAGDVVEIKVLRDGKPVTLKVTLAKRPAPDAVAPPIEPAPVRPIPVDPPSTAKPTLGFSAADAANGGLEVRALTDGGPAAQAGMKVGDRVISIDGMEIADRDSLRLVLGALKPGQKVPVTIVRAGKEMKLTMTVGGR